MLPEGASGGFTPRPPAPRRVPTPHQPQAGGTPAPSYGPGRTGIPSDVTHYAPAPLGTGTPGPVGQFLGGAVQALNPVNYYRSWREDPLMGLKMFTAQGQQEMGDEMIQGFQEDPARTAGSLAAGLAGLKLPFKTNFKLPKSAPGAAERVQNYPMMDSSIWRIKNRGMGEHYGFGGRLGSVEDRTIRAQQAQAPSMAEHIAQLDALEAARGGVPPALDRMLASEQMTPQFFDNMAYKYTDRPMASVLAKDEVPSRFPGLKYNEPRRPSNPGKRISKAEGDELGRMLGAFDEDELPMWMSHNYEEGLQYPTLSPQMQGGLIGRQGINQSRARGSYMDQGGPMTPEMLAGLLGRSGFWRAK